MNTPTPNDAGTEKGVEMFAVSRASAFEFILIFLGMCAAVSAVFPIQLIAEAEDHTEILVVLILMAVSFLLSAVLFVGGFLAMTIRVNADKIMRAMKDDG